jgi:uncharacterized protein YyaL (SSP411 family)
MSFTERIEQSGDSSVPQCSPIVRLRMIYFTLCFVAIGCLDADQGSVVVKPRRAKGSAVSSSESSSPRKTKSSRKADSDRDEKVLNHPELQAELAQVDDLIRTVGGDDAQKPSRKKIRSADEDSVVTAFAEEVVTPTNQAAKGARKNRLAKESSPYLLLHATNPVDWFPWGPEALERAKKEKKLIFLSIGYSSCHWCHVMERLVFSNEQIARFMNENFVCVKVDREERPDIDDIYMTALTVYFRLSGSDQSGGWPLSLFLTPEGKPIAGGTYFPPDDQDGRMGFPTVMNKIASLWRDETQTLEKNADILTANVRRTMTAKIVLKDVPLTAELASTISSSIAETYDAKFGGFDFNPARPNAPKFPVPSKLGLLLYQAQRDRDDALRTKVTSTLNAMAAGGIRDHLAGGFHRYSTDRAWKVPHFEKMLYDNAQLADIYLEAFRQTSLPENKVIAEEVCDFVLREMTDKRGGFFSALDADSEDVEGKSYVWSEKEIDKLLGPDDAEAFKLAYGLDVPSSFEIGNVLFQPKPLTEIANDLKVDPAELDRRLKTAKQRLLAARNRRPPPLCDDKILTGWNGLMIKALANAGARFNRADYLAAAERAAIFILTEMRDEQGRLRRSYRGSVSPIKAYLDDYAYLVDGLLSLHIATRDPKWLAAATRLTDDQLKLFWDEAAGGFFYTATDHEELLARSKDRYDSVVPSGNSVSVRNLLRIASLAGKDEYRDKAEQTLKAFAPLMSETPLGSANMAVALFEFLDQPNFGSSRRSVDPHVVPAGDEEVLDVALKPKREDLGAGLGASPLADKTPKGDKTKKIDILTAEAHLNVDRLPAGSTCRVAMILNIQDGWHINQNPPQPDFVNATRFTMKTKQGTKLVEVKYPKGHKINAAGFDEPVMVYDGQIVLFGTIEIPESAAGKVEEFELQVRYQACSESRCEPPKTLTLSGRLEVAPVGEKVKSVNDKLFNPPKGSPKKN